MYPCTRHSQKSNSVVFAVHVHTCSRLTETTYHDDFCSVYMWDPTSKEDRFMRDMTKVCHIPIRLSIMHVFSYCFHNRIPSHHVGRSNVRYARVRSNARYARVRSNVRYARVRSNARYSRVRSNARYARVRSNVRYARVRYMCMFCV